MNCRLLCPQNQCSPCQSSGWLGMCALLLFLSIAVGCGGSGRSPLPVMGHLTIAGNFPSATVNTTYSANLTAKGGTPPYQFSIASGTLPNGLSLDTNGGTITGTPINSGMFNFTVHATDLAQDAAGQQALAIQVSPAAISVSVNPLSSTLASAGTQQFTATVKNSPNTSVTWTATVGFISSSGFYTAPFVFTPTTLTVAATSVSDPTKSASAAVLVQAQVPTSGSDNRYCSPGDVPNFATAYDGPAQLPTSCINTAISSTPSNGNLFFVANGGDVQGVLNSAACGDVVALEAGGTFAPVSLPAKPCDAAHWITLRTSAPDSGLPPEGTRISPCYAGVASLPGRPALNCTSTKNVMATLLMAGTSGSGPLTFLAGANHYRLIGLEITRTANGAFIGNLAIPAAGATGDHIILDRVWMHGTAQEETARGIYMSGLTYAAVVDSYFSDFHCESLTGTCTEAQALSGGLGGTQDGPYKIVNNFLESSTQSILFGGGKATTTPSDIEVRRNHFFKPMIWMPGSSGFVGGLHGNPFMVKNHFELKNAQRVLFEGNLTENTWGGFSQTGFSVLLTPKNQGTPNGSVCPLCQVTDVTIRYSKFSHMGGGLQIANAITPHTTNAALAGERYSLHDLILEDINGPTYAGLGQLAQISTSPLAPLLSDLQIAHITAFPSQMLFDIGNGLPNQKMPNFLFANSIVTTGAYPIWSTGGGATNCAYGNVPNGVLNNCFNGYSFGYNALVGAPAKYPPSSWPSGNAFPPDANAVGFVNFNNGNGGDYHLQSGSTYKNAGSDGKDLGADIDAVVVATGGVY